MEQIYVGSIIVSLLVGLLFTQLKPSTLFLTAAMALYLLGYFSSQSFLNHFANESIVTLLLLIVSSLAIEKTRFLGSVARTLFHKSQSITLFRMMFIIGGTSAIMNNTAVVASLLQKVRKNHRHSPQKLLIPLSYFAIFGGMLTLIGTSTNLVINSFLIDNGLPELAFFEFFPVGLAALLICGIATCILSSLLPKGKVENHICNDYYLEATIEANSKLVEKTVEQAGLRELDNLFLVEIIKKTFDGKELLIQATPETKLNSGDKLIFCGDVKQIQQLNTFSGLTMFAQRSFSDRKALVASNLVEVIVSPSSTLVQKTLKQANFRSQFDAAVIAIGRAGEHISGKLGQVKLRPGDRLVLAVADDFYKHKNLTRNFYLLDGPKLTKPLTPVQEATSILGFLLVISSAALGLTDLLTSLIIFLAISILSNSISPSEIRRRLPIDLWLIVSSALCIASAFISSGLSNTLSEGIIEILGQNSAPFTSIIFLFFATWFVTEIITNNAAAAIMFPIALGISTTTGVDILPLAVTIAFGASASFISPFGYQTNLLVFNAGDYKFRDFLKFGLPILFTYSAVVLTMIRVVYGIPF